MKTGKKEYWTYKDRAKEQKEKNLRSGQYDKPVQYDKKSTPKSRFIHDLMVDFAIYLRKWAEQVDYEFPENTTDMPAWYMIWELKTLENCLMERK